MCFDNREKNAYFLINAVISANQMKFILEGVWEENKN